MTAIVCQGNALDLHLPDACVDLVVTSPPYFGLRSYQDDGQHYAGQVGDEATPTEYLDALIAATAEWCRVLKPGGSIFVNLGDKYKSNPGRVEGQDDVTGRGPRTNRAGGSEIPSKSLHGLPWRYAIRCIDQLGLILRAEIVWAKPNGLPESVTDRVRRSHEQVFHFVKQSRYYSAVDEVREAHVTRDAITRIRTSDYAGPMSGAMNGAGNPLGKLPGSVWQIPTAPLTVPASLGVDHFAAFPPELVRRIVLGWSPREVCTVCGEGRRPVVERGEHQQAGHGGTEVGDAARGSVEWGEARQLASERSTLRTIALRTVTAATACVCGIRETDGKWNPHVDSARPSSLRAGRQPALTAGGAAGGAHSLPMPSVSGNGTPVAEPPTALGIVLDPFGGTGTTALVASAYGRVGVSVDLSADYCRLAQWRTTDPGERARVLGVPKPEPVPEGQLDMFGELSG